MTWNDYIDKSYENMITVLAELGKQRLRELINIEQDMFASHQAYIACIQKDYLVAMRDVSEVVFDEDMREYLKYRNLDDLFVRYVRENDPLRADQIVQRAANEANMGVVREWLEDYLAE